jgi:16S rRNA (cytidine1402-2'-O)-methyltransferase
MGTLYIIATPIGNMEDLSFRAVRVLGELDALACEDTRQTRRIFERFDIQSPRTIFSYHEHNEENAGKRIIGLLNEGLSVGVCTDGGYPGISDPGYRAIAAAREGDHEVVVLPGASAVPTALLASGLPTSSYTFKGFPPRKSGQRQRFFAADAELPHTMVVFESPFRIGKMLADAHTALGNRLAAVCVEMTKKFEKVHRGYLADLAESFADRKVKGEITVVIAGNNPKFAADDPEDD